MGGQMLWADRVKAAYASWQRWHLIPGRFRMDRVLKDAGVRDLVVENERLRQFAQEPKMTADVIDRATAAIRKVHDDEIRAYLAGEIEANVWRPERYAKAALAAALAQGPREDDFWPAALDDKHPAA